MDGWSSKPLKTSNPLCKVESYYSSGSSSQPLKQVFQFETEVESSKIVVMPVIIIGKNSWEEVAALKAMLEKLLKKSEDKGGTDRATGRKDQQVDQKAGEATNLIHQKKLRK